MFQVRGAMVVVLFAAACGRSSDESKTKGGTGTERKTVEGSAASPSVPAAEQKGPAAVLAREQTEEATTQKLPISFRNQVGMSFVLIPHGDFIMGSLESEKGRHPVELLHRVVLTRAFYLSQFETTNAQFRRFKPSHDSGTYKQGRIEIRFDGAECPVCNVSHTDASEYAAWLSKNDPRYAYRLPTASEWEYACRAGTTTSRYWGDGEAEAQHYENVWSQHAKDVLGWRIDAFPFEQTTVGPTPVGAFLPNPWGLFDMLGNVAEWCADWNIPDHRTPEDVRAIFQEEDPTGVSDIGRSERLDRVMRGGAWMFSPGDVRSASRFGKAPSGRGPGLGFRLAADRKK